MADVHRERSVRLEGLNIDRSPMLAWSTHEHIERLYDLAMHKSINTRRGCWMYDRSVMRSRSGNSRFFGCLCDPVKIES
jgi:hypothetical protein